MFGVGTDYCLLLVSRYREELRRIEDKHEAMARALRRAGPAILASGLTVALAMLVLAARRQREHELARTGRGDRGVHGHGRRPDPAAHAAHDLRPQGVLAPAKRGRLRPGASVGRAARGRGGASATGCCSDPAWRWSVTGVLFVAGAFGLLAYKVDYSTTSFFKHSVEGVEGFDVIEERLPRGHLGADDRPGGERQRTRDAELTSARCETRLRGVNGVATVSSDRERDRPTVR